MRLVLVDAYDSFTHNLAQALGIAGASVEVVRCDEVVAPQLLDAELVVLSPGPGTPAEAGCFLDAAGLLTGQVPLLGVCLGHQALAVALGGTLRTPPPVHGHATPIHHDRCGLFAGLPPAVPMTRYHSLGIDQVPACLAVTAVSDDGAIQGVRHRSAPAWGVQFHPESVLSGAAGQALLERFIELGMSWHARATRVA
ncbi:MAG TPA: aminodeoxychorismate/anthranilate synthase component II [Deltaproteobacteria bacterium]|nr:aminodeoxychorismate/anthranilate synthase component II [Deltaproteobacteria bacterium]